MLINRFLRYFGRRTVETDDLAAGGLAIHLAVLAREFPACPSCGKALGGHRMFKIGAYVDSPQQRDSILAAIRDRDWNLLLKAAPFNPEEDALLVDLIECPEGGWVVAVTRDPYEPCGKEVAVHIDAVRSEDGPQLRSRMADPTLTGVLPAP